MATSDTERRTSVRYQPDENPAVRADCRPRPTAAILCVAGIVLTPAIVIRAGGGTEAYLSWAIFAAVMR